jgi:hypothetical protein
MEHLACVLILTITTSFGAVSTQKEYANTYSNSVELQLPTIKSADDIPAAIAAITHEVNNGDLTLQRNPDGQYLVRGDEHQGARHRRLFYKAA